MRVILLDGKNDVCTQARLLLTARILCAVLTPNNVMCA